MPAYLPVEPTPSRHQLRMQWRCHGEAELGIRQSRERLA